MLRIDPSSPVPQFEQLKRQLVDLIEAGELPPGTRLPSVRRLASDLGLAPGTVARAYRELEVAGLVVTGGRHGTAVAQRDVSAETEAAARERVAQLVGELRRLGLSPSAISALVARALEP